MTGVEGNIMLALKGKILSDAKGSTGLYLIHCIYLLLYLSHLRQLPYHSVSKRTNTVQSSKLNPYLLFMFSDFILKCAFII